MRWFLDRANSPSSGFLPKVATANTTSKTPNRTEVASVPSCAKLVDKSVTENIVGASFGTFKLFTDFL